VNKNIKIDSLFAEKCR